VSRNPFNCLLDGRQELHTKTVNRNS
jgi:hypothetical protein